MKRLLIFGFSAALFLAPKILTDMTTDSRAPASVTRRPSAAAEAIHILPLSADFPVKDLKNDGYQIVTDDDSGDDEPTPQARDEILRKVGAWPYAKKLNQLDRGFLYLRAREYTGAKFAKAYPMLAPKTRAKLQELAKRGGWSP